MDGIKTLELKIRAMDCDEEVEVSKCEAAIGGETDLDFEILRGTITANDGSLPLEQWNARRKMPPERLPLGPCPHRTRRPRRPERRVALAADMVESVEVLKAPETQLFSASAVPWRWWNYQPPQDLGCSPRLSQCHWAECVRQALPVAEGAFRPSDSKFTSEISYQDRECATTQFVVIRVAFAFLLPRLLMEKKSTRWSTLRVRNGLPELMLEPV